MRKTCRVWLAAAVLLTVLSGCGSGASTTVEAGTQAGETPAAAAGTPEERQTEAEAAAFETPPALAAAEPTPEQGTADTFSDIAGHPEEPYILEGLRQGFYSVPPDGRYRPDDAATGAEFAAALWNLAGRPEADADAPETRDDAEAAVSWALEAGYATVDSLPMYEPVTRLAAMELLYNFNGRVAGLEAVLTGIYNQAFLDSGDVPLEGQPALYWGFYNVFIKEQGANMVAPYGTLSRGEMAEALVRFQRDFRSEPTDD